MFKFVLGFSGLNEAIDLKEDNGGYKMKSGKHCFEKAYFRTRPGQGIPKLPLGGKMGC